jgi:hypothetical protein
MICLAQKAVKKSTCWSSLFDRAASVWLLSAAAELAASVLILVLM